MALDADTLDRYIARAGPYLFHGTRPDLVETILVEGLKPPALTGIFSSLSGEQGFRSRPGHVYLGSLDRISRLQVAPQLQIDLRKLELERFCCDEDSLWEAECGPAACEMISHLVGSAWPDHAPVFSNMYDWREAGGSFGDWADVYAPMIDTPERVSFSLGWGSIAYDGIIGPQAISLFAA